MTTLPSAALLRDLEAAASTPSAPARLSALAELAARPRRLPAVDTVLRSWRSRFPGGATGDDPLALALAACARSGFDREAAVRRILERPHEHHIPFLVIRTTDHVRQVRDPARAGLAVLLHDNPRCLDAAAETAVVVEGRTRGGFVRALVVGAIAGDPRSVMATSRSRWARRYAVKAGLSAFSVAELTAIARGDSDLRVRVDAAEVVVRESLWTTRHGPLRALSTARDGRVRALAAMGLLRAGLREDLAALLADPSALVRATARTVVPDAVEHYRNAVRTAPTRGCVDGLAETGGLGDIPLLATLAGHPSRKLRARADRAIRLLTS